MWQINYIITITLKQNPAINCQVGQNTPVTCICVDRSLGVKEEFVLQQRFWGENPICYVIFTFILYFSILSPVLVCYMSVARLRVVVQPVASKFKEKSFVLKHICVSYICTSCSAVTLTLLMWGFGVAVPFKLCSPFVDPTNNVLVIKISTAFLSLLQPSVLVSLIAIHICLVSELQKSGQKVQKSKSQSIASIVVQVIVLTFGSTFCWIPSNTIFSAAMFLRKYPLELVFWATVVISTVNPILYPLVFLVTSLKKHFAWSQDSTVAIHLTDLSGS